MQEYKLEFSGATIPYTKNSRVQQYRLSDKAFAICNNTLYEFELTSSKPLIRTTKDEEYPLENAQLLYVEPIDNEQTAIIVKVTQGIRIYLHTKEALHLAVEDDKFHDAFGWHKPGNGIHFGHFYHDSNILGIMASHAEKKTAFYAIFKDVLLAGDFPVYPLDTNVDIIETSSPHSAGQMLANLSRKPRQSIVSRNRDGITCFMLNESNGLDIVLKTPIGGTETYDEGLFLADITHQKYNDIVHFNASGLFVYQFHGNYKFIHYNPLFSEEKGWTKEHTKTVRFADVNADGIVDMVFTGPKGISAMTYDKYSDLWNNVIQTSMIPPSLRHARVMHVFTNDESEVYVFAHHEESIHWAKVAPLPKKPPKEIGTLKLPENVVATTSMTPPQTYSPRAFKTLPLLRDMDIWSDILNCVEQETGKPKFTLPLVNLPDPLVKLLIFYDATQTVNDVLGIGWSMPMNLIAMDDNGSIFEDDAVYVIAFQDSTQALKYLPKESTSKVRTYTLPSSDGKLKYRAKFHVDEDRWVIDLGTGTKQIYGHKEDAGAISKDIVWKNWHGPGFDIDDRVARSRMWYLAEVQDERGNMVLKFFYESVVAGVITGLEYTDAVYMRGYKDIHGNEINFRYKQKETNEYITYDHRDQEGNFNWVPTQTRYLDGYTFSMPSSGKQEVNFRYITSNGQRFLSEIRQTKDVISSYVAKFEYSTFPLGKFGLKNAILPYGVEVVFTYAGVGESNPRTELKRVDVVSDYRVTTGDDYVLISFVNNKGPGQVVMRMFSRDMTKELYTSESKVRNSTKGRWPLLGEHGSTISHDVLQGSDFFGVLLFFSYSKRLCLFGRAEESGDWLNESHCHEYGSEAIIEPGEDFLLVSDPGKTVELLRWKPKDKTWNLQTVIPNAGNIAVSVHENKFVTYDNYKLSLWYTTGNGILTNKPLLNVADCLSETETILKRFNLNDDNHKLFSAAFRNNALKFNKNLIALKCLKINGSQLQSSLKLYTINNLKEVSIQRQVTIDHDNLQTFVSKEEKDKEGNYFKFKYEIRSNGEFFIKVDDFRGTLLEKLRANNALHQKDEVIKEFEKSLNSPAKRFILDVQKYLMSFFGKIVVLNDQKLTFGGKDWQQTLFTEHDRNRESAYIPLSDKFVLRKENKDSPVKLLRKSSGETLLQLTDNINDLRVFYPVYMATQTKDAPVRLVEFHDNSVSEKTLSRSETLSPYSNAMMLITHEGGDNKNVIFREQFGVKRFQPNSVVREVTVIFDDDRRRRVTGYEYDMSSGKLMGKTIVYSNMTIIPGNDKSAYGWLKQSLTDDRITTAYDNKGQIVKQIPNKEERRSAKGETDEEMAFRKATTIYDRSGNLQIAQCAPFRLDDETVGYYGFEDYEHNAIGTSKKWNFETSNIIRNGFSLTGKNYLSQKTEPIEGVFHPNDQNSEYIASTWIRVQNTNTVPRIGEVSPYLRAMVLTSSGNEVVSLLSQVKFRLDDWIYLELVVDLQYARKSAAYDLQRDKLQIAIRVGPMQTTPIDIDHVRFAPLIADFGAYIYDASTKLNTAVIQSTGSIKRSIYDVYSDVVSKINEENQIEELTVYTKAAASKTSRCTVNVKPEMGFYEQFAPFSFVYRWKIKNIQSWQIAPYQLEHHGHGSDSLQLATQDIVTTSYGFRVIYSLLDNHAAIIINNSLELSNKTLKLSGNSHVIPSEGEIMLVKENDRLMVWIDGGLYIDQTSEAFNNPLTFTMRGAVSIRDMIVFSRPTIKVVYQNSLDEPIQEISLESSESVVVKERLYDTLGRQRITTQEVRIVRSKFEPLMMYYQNFVTNDVVGMANSVWETGRLEGLASMITGHSYAFVETKYDANPLNEKTSLGLPGKEFSTSGSFARRYTSKTANLFIQNRYPLSMNVSYQIELKPGKVEDITVLNSANKKIAHFVHIPGSKDLFATYKLDSEGNVLQVLPPLYFERVGSFHKTNLQLQTIDENDLRLQRKMCIHAEYNQHGKPTRKTSPDAGAIENIYDHDQQLRFVVYYSYVNPQVVESIIYFTYDRIGRVISTGHLLDPTIAKHQLMNITLDRNNSRQYQIFNYADFERDPMLRGRLFRSITMNNDEPFAEVLYTNGRENALEKSIILQNLNKKPDKIVISKSYLGGRLRTITYPANYLGEPFRVVYGFDRLGHINSIGTPEDPYKFVKLRHNAGGQIIEEMYEPASMYTFKHEREYNEPGFLTKLKNPFQTEEISFTTSSYGGAIRGDGSVTRIKFSTNWHQLASSSGLGLQHDSFINDSISPADSAGCFKALKAAGYLDDRNRQVKAFYPDVEIDFPIVCTFGTTGRHVSNVLGRQGFPREHGYRFAYGAYQDLTKAKYFVGGEEPQALQPDTFAKEIPRINSGESRRIWRALRAAQFFVEDPDRTNISTSHGKESRKNFIGSKLFSDLREVNQDYAAYAGPLRKLLTSKYSNRQGNVTLMQLKDLIHKWRGNLANADLFEQRVAADIFEMLRQKRYFINPLDGEFVKILKDFEAFIPDIVRVLFTYFGKQLGRSEYDVESYEIDANGNHKKFNTGYDHYGLQYETDSNRVEGVKYKAFDRAKPEEVFRMQHDSRGNVIQALHKGIQTMIYHPVSNLLQRVQMVDGNSVEFYYDSKGERILKRLKARDGQVRKEMHYLRDEQGRTLVERELNFITANQPPSVMITMYVYGAHGIVGFVRRDQFYSVLTDHQGSVRLIVRDGEVVAAYDYLPYGNFMRIFGADSESHIPYRYTGQEWDPEIGLYNYHARFYDPSIGRFYQIDPKEQYFSPYKYAGNSPVSMVDPSGEIGLTLLIVSLISMAVGAYLSGAAANNSFKPWEWKLNWNTVIAVALGGLTGFFLPGGFMASITAFGVAGFIGSSSLGLLLSYFSAAAANGSFNPGDWDFSSPRTYSALFDGFAMGATAITGFRNVFHFYKDLQTTGKLLFVGGSVIAGTGLFVMGGIATNWDAKKPQFWFATISSVMAAPELVMFGASGYKSIKNGLGDLKSNIGAARTNYGNYKTDFIRMRKEFGRSVYSSAHEIFKTNKELTDIASTLGKAVGIGATTFTFGIVLNHGFGNWSEVGTYQNILTAIQLGTQVGRAGRHAIKAVKKKLELRKSTKALHLMEDVAMMAKREWTRIIEDTELRTVTLENGEVIDRRQVLRDHPNFNANVKNSLRANEVPNTAMTVVVAGDIAIVGFSTSKAPGLYLVYDHDNLTNPTLRNSIVVDDNGIVGGKPVAVRDDSILATRIGSAIEGIQDGIKNKNRQEYEDRNLHDDLVQRAASDATVDAVVQENIVRAIHDEIQLNGFVDEMFISRKFDELRFNNAAMREASAALGAVQDEAYRLTQERSAGIRDRESREANKNRLAELKSEKSTLMRAYEQVKLEQRKQYRLKLYEPIKEFEQRITKWEITNCAEPHTLLALERQRELFDAEYFHRKSYDIALDVDYMGTWRTKDLPHDITGFQRCDHCMETTKLVKNVLTDTDFMENLKVQGKHHLDEALKAGEKLQFLRPILVLHNTIEQERERNRKEVRTKRSATVSQPIWYKQPFKWMKSFRSLPRNSTFQPNNESILELGDGFLSKTDVNGTLLLADVVLAKCHRRKINQMSTSTAHPLDKAELMCNILELFENAIEEAADISGIPVGDINVDSFTMQESIMPLLRRQQLDGISEVMLNHAVGALNNTDITDELVDNFQEAFESLRLSDAIEEMMVRMKEGSVTAEGADMAYSARFERMNTSDTLAALPYTREFIN